LTPARNANLVTVVQIVRLSVLAHFRCKRFVTSILCHGFLKVSFSRNAKRYCIAPYRKVSWTLFNGKHLVQEVQLFGDLLQKYVYWWLIVCFLLSFK